VDVDTVLAELFELVAPHLTEKQRRLLAGAAARALGRGGGARMARISGVSRPTVYAGVRELDAPPDPRGRVRGPGGGPRRLVERQPGLLAALDELVDPDTRGDPESPLRWTCKSTRQLADALGAQGFQVSDDTVGRLLKQQGYTLQRTQKTLEGAQHPDRDAQFRYLNEQAREHLAASQPVVSVDTKKKELVGRYANGGREWRPVGEPAQVAVHDFPDPEVGKAIPYGVYDLGANAGWVSVGTDHDTAAFAVATLRHWWEQAGRGAYPQAERLLITADAGGSNGYRIRAWKTELARFAAETGLAVTVCHFPPGTSKWNKIEHRLFSHISMNWRGRSLVSHEVIVELIAATQTRSGLTVHAELDRGRYPLGVRISDRELATVPLRRHDWHGEWNYTVLPTAA
jgi:Rhodopirellula transposase DDE domain